MNKEEKENFVAELHSRLERSKGSFLVDYQGLNVEAINQLRNELRKVGTEFQVVKNRLLKLASRDTDAAVLEENMHGPSAVAFAYEDVAASAKVLVKLAAELKGLDLKTGQIEGKTIEPEGIKRLSELPSKEVLLAQTLSAMQAVPGSFVRLLNGIVTQLVYVLKAIEQKKGEAA